MNGWLDHLMIVPVLLPLATGGLMLLLGGGRRTLRALLGLFATLTLVVVAIALLRQADAALPEGGAMPAAAYLLGNWPAPFGIVLVLDRLSALMLVLTSVLALAALVFSLARWHRVGPNFHPMFQLLLMGINGAFLTGDLFNLFVFFEIMLAASYGLVLYGSGARRVRAGMHYIAVNLASSSLILIGVSLIYGVTGTLNMADLATRIPEIAPENRVLLEVGAAILGVAFLVKSGMWPLSFWLPAAYSAAAPPAAAIFAIMTKVGVYVVLRLSLLLFGDHSGASADFGGDWLLIGGMATIAFGAIGVLAAQDSGRLAGFAVLTSSGTMLAAIGMGSIPVTSGALFYMVGSTLAIGAFFLLIELVERGREAGADVLAVTMEVFGDAELDAEDEEEVGVAIPATMAILGAAFFCCALELAALPPLSGFVGKFALLTAALNPQGLGIAEPIPAESWMLLGLLILSGLAALIAMTRAGIRSFWSPLEREVPPVNVIEIAPVAGLLLLCMTLTVLAGPAMRYMDATVQSLDTPRDYVQGVLSAPRARGMDDS